MSWKDILRKDDSFAERMAEEYKKEFTETRPEEFSKEKGFRPVHESKEERLKTITETPYTFKTKKAHDKT